MLVVVLTASTGCTGLDYVPNHDIVVLKLTPDGSLEWTRVIDHGFDDTAADLVELPGGGFAIAAQTSDQRLAAPRPLLVRLSPDGAVLWDRSVTDGFGVAQAVVSVDDGGTAVLTGNGTVVRSGPDGRTLWARATGIPEPYALVSTADGGYLAGGRIMYQVPVNGTAEVIRLPVITTETPPSGGGPVLARMVEQVTTPMLAQVPRRFNLVGKAMVVQLAPDCAIDWERQYDDGGLNWLQSLAEGPAGTGLLVSGYGDTLNGSRNIVHPLLALHLSPDGTPASVTQIDTASVGDPIRIRSDAAGYRMLYQNTTEQPTAEGFYSTNVVDAVLDRDGRVLERRPVEASIAITWTADGGYFSVGIPPVGNRSRYDTVTYDQAGGTFHARRLDSAGALAWDRVLAAPLGRVVKVVQTADGGYAVLGLRQNR